jgi:hypothetical protein
MNRSQRKPPPVSPTNHFSCASARSGRAPSDARRVAAPKIKRVRFVMPTSLRGATDGRAPSTPFEGFAVAILPADHRERGESCIRAFKWVLAMDAGPSVISPALR